MNSQLTPAEIAAKSWTPEQFAEDFPDVVESLVQKRAENLAAEKKANEAPADSTVTLSLEETAKKEFAEKQEIRDEFKTLDCYLAFRKAEAQGRARIVGLRPKETSHA